jgi:hypothetical protein
VLSQRGGNGGYRLARPGVRRWCQAHPRRGAGPLVRSVGRS